MPTIRIAGEGESEAVRGAGVAAAGDVGRVASNAALSEHVGKFVAGEVLHRFGNENLADKLGGRNAIHVSFSWG